MKSIKVCEYSRSRSFHYVLILQDQASGERSQDQWSSGFIQVKHDCRFVNDVTRLSYLGHGHNINQVRSSIKPCYTSLSTTQIQLKRYSIGDVVGYTLVQTLKTTLNELSEISKLVSFTPRCLLSVQ